MKDQTIEKGYPNVSTFLKKLSKILHHSTCSSGYTWLLKLFPKYHNFQIFWEGSAFPDAPVVHQHGYALAKQQRSCAKKVNKTLADRRHRRVFCTVNEDMNTYYIEFSKNGKLSTKFWIPRRTIIKLSISYKFGTLFLHVFPRMSCKHTWATMLWKVRRTPPLKKRLL